MALPNVISNRPIQQNFDAVERQISYVQGEIDTLASSISASVVTATIGDGTATTFVVTHSLGTRTPTVVVYQTLSPYSQVLVEVRATTTTTITLYFDVTPSTNQYKVKVST